MQECSLILDIVIRYCVNNSISFKALRSRAALFLYNSKNWSRSSSGKFIAIYPKSDKFFKKYLFELSELLTGFTGPYILTDSRFKSGPVYFRYGAFIEQYAFDPTGHRFLAIKNLDGELIPDRRVPGYICPDFVTIPEEVAEAQRQPKVTNQLTEKAGERFEIVSAIKFSNAGGLYLGIDKESGNKVRIREARPHAGLDSIHRDAVERLDREAGILNALSQARGVPTLIAVYQEWEHRYLVSEFIEGRQLLELITDKFPFVTFQPLPRDVEEYRNWVDDIVENVRVALKEIHGLGVYVGDIHPSNIIIDAFGEVHFVDLEDAGHIHEEYTGPGMRAAGFGDRTAKSGIDLDQSNLNKLRLMMMYPMTAILDLNPNAELSINEEINHLYRSNCEPNTTLSKKGEVIKPEELPHCEPSSLISEIHDKLIAALWRRADIGRADRLFPADPRLHVFGKASLGYGAAGVIFAAAVSDAKVPDQVIDWLVGSLDDADAVGGQGLFDGYIGVALALMKCQRVDEGLAVVKAKLLDKELPMNDNFAIGKAGLAYVAQYIFELTGDRKIKTFYDNLLSTLVAAAEEGQSHILTGEKGIFSGFSGIAITFLDAFERSGGNSLLTLAKKLIKRDLESGVINADGTFHLVTNGKKLPYLHRGSSGVAIAISRYLEFEQDAGLESILAATQRTFSIPFVLQAGLFEGRAGLLHAAQCCNYRFEQAHQIDRLNLYSVTLDSGLAFAGRGLQRVSDDLITGSAGVALALASFKHPNLLCIRQ